MGPHSISSERDRAYWLPRDTGHSHGEGIWPLSVPQLPNGAQKAHHTVYDASVILWSWMTVIISLFFLTEKHKAFSKGLGIVNHVSFWLLIKKKKKRQNESLQNKYHQEACRKQLQPCWKSDSCTGSCCSFLQEQLQAGLLLEGTTGLATGIQQDLHNGSQNRRENPTATAEDTAYALNTGRRPLQGPFVNMCITAGPFVFMWSDMILSPL